MVSNFHIHKLKELLKDFYNITKIRITVFDEQFHELASFPEQIAPICQLIRSDPNGMTQCKKCDENACRHAAQLHALYTYRCHAGLTESITPIYLGNIIIGYLLFGHVLSYPSHEEALLAITESCHEYRINKNLLAEACYGMPLHSQSYITSASHILETVANYLCMEHMAYLRHQELPVQIDAYIQMHFTEELDAMDIARTFDIGKTQLYEIAKRIYGTGIAGHIRHLRIEKAKQLLLDTKLPLAEIASQCGFKDYNYFITVFKRTVGISPKKYKHHAE